MPQIGDYKDGKYYTGPNYGWQSPETIKSKPGAAEAIWRSRPGELNKPLTLPGLGTKVYTGKNYGYQLQATIDKRQSAQQAQQAAAIQRQKNLEAGSRKQGESTADFHRRLRQQLDADKPTTRDTTGSDTTRGEVRQPAKPVAKTYDVDGEKLTKAQINTRYNELRKQAGGLQPGSSAEKFGMSANQAIFGKNFAKPKTPNPMMTKYKHPSVEAYEVVLDYLLSEGHADTVEEAHYVMMQLDSEYVQSIVESGLPIPPGGIKPDRLNPIDPATGKSMYKVIEKGGKPKEIRNPSFGKLPPA